MNRKVGLALTAIAVLAIGAGRVGAAPVIAGSFQGWDPPTGVVMTETALGSGVFAATITGLSGNHEFKILDDGGSPPAAWGDPELTPNNSWFNTDGDGTMTIQIDTTAGNAVSVSDDVTTVFAVGDFMDEAGGAGDWNPGDATFRMTGLAGIYSISKTIATPGTYEYKATRGDWGGQWGANGRNVNASTLMFTTTVANQMVTFGVNQNTASISATVAAIPEPASVAVITCGLAFAMGCRIASRK